MKKGYIDITVVLDRSGSMGGVREETIKGFNEFVKEQKALDKDICLTLVQFDHEYQVDYTAHDIKTLQNLDYESYQPRGTTALLDAIGRTINSAGQRFAGMHENKRPEKVLFVIITDGFENASSEFTGNKIKEMIEHQKGKYSWQFVYLGADQDAFTVGASYGVLGANNYNYHNNAAGVTKMWKDLTVGASVYACSTRSVVDNFFDQNTDTQAIDPAKVKSTTDATT